MTGISVKTLQNYESGLYKPPEDVARKMAVVYDANSFAMEWLYDNLPTVSEVFPRIQILDLTEVVLTLQSKAREFTNYHDRLVNITCDGVISDEELETWKEILGLTKDLAAWLLSLEYAKQKESCNNDQDPQRVISLTSTKRAVGFASAD